MAFSIGKGVEYTKSDNSKVVLNTKLAEVDTHIADSVKHITGAERTAWNAAKTAASVTVADTGNNFTGTDVEAVLLELFTLANNGKTDIATVIGSPALSSETFAQLKTHIQNGKNTLATNLTAKGQTATGTEALSALATKVASIIVGKRSATGSAFSSATTKSFNNYADSPISLYFVEVVASFGFVPSIVIVQQKMTTNTQSISTSMLVPFGNMEGNDIFAGKSMATTSTTEYRRLKLSAGGAYKNASGFCLPLDSSLTSTPVEFHWIAIE